MRDNKWVTTALAHNCDLQQWVDYFLSLEGNEIPFEDEEWEQQQLLESQIEEAATASDMGTPYKIG